MLKIPTKVPEKGFYYHYKHDPAGIVNNYAYEVVGVGFHTENDQSFVVYRPLYREASVYEASLSLGIPCFDARPSEMWMEGVEKDGIVCPRFQKITDPTVISKLEKVREEMYK